MLNQTEQQEMLAANFSRALAESGIAPKELAERCGISEQAVSNWKRTGKISLHHLPVVAAATGWSIQRLLTGAEAESPSEQKRRRQVFEDLTHSERELLGDIRILIDEDREEVAALVRERARRARAYLERIARDRGLPIISTKKEREGVNED